MIDPRWATRGMTRREKLLYYTDTRGINECWPWTGLLSPKGYGRCRCEGFQWQSHRLTWEEFKGPIPEGLEVLHHCDFPACQNYKKHLFLGTQADNIADCLAKGRIRNKWTADAR
jgi:hypothetical protein